MGTRSLTVIQEDSGKEIAVLYRQYDGHPDCHGQHLKDFLYGFTIVNGMGFDDPPKIANGMNCLAAQIVAHFKKQPGNFYLYPAGVRDCGEEYVYTIYTKDKKLCMRVQSGAVTFFGMPGTKQSNMPVLFDGPIGDFDATHAIKVQMEVRNETPNDFIEGQDKAAQ